MSTTTTYATLAAGVAVVMVVCGVGVLAFAALDAGCAGAPASPRASVRWDENQTAHAATIVAVGARLDVPRYGWVVAVATVMQESGLRNLGHLGERNDHDSLGLFQQRPSQGWGTPAQVMDPTYAATAFYVTLLRVPGWESMLLTQAAQAVQRSAYPTAYAKWEPDARTLVTEVAARFGPSVACPAGGWVAPLDAGSYRLSSPYGRRWGTFHRGQDFAAPTGTPIRAAAAGIVVQAGCTSPFCDRPGSVDATGRPTTPGCGYTVKLLHDAGVATTYCHAGALAVRDGDLVVAGQVIGWVGSTGHSTGPHLHFQVHRGAPPIDSSTTVDPVEFLSTVGIQV